MMKTMQPEAFLRGKKELFAFLKPGAFLAEELEKKIIDVYGARGKRAIDAIKKRCVIRRGRRWFVRGRTDEYEVVKSFCTCKDYVMNIATGKVEVDMCYHALAKTICERLGTYYVLEPGER